MTNADLQAIRERCAKATPPPWELHNPSSVRVCTPGDSEQGCRPIAEADAAFIAHARQDIPKLLAEVKRLRTALAAKRKAKRKACGPYFLFAGEDHYPDGGLRDYHGAFPTIEAAEEWLHKHLDPSDYWAHASVLRDGELLEVCKWTDGPRECSVRTLSNGRKCWHGWKRNVVNHVP